MFTVLIALILLAAGIAAIYLLLKNMGQEGVEIAAPGSCKRGRCGVPDRAAETFETAEAETEASAGQDTPRT